MCCTIEGTDGIYLTSKGQQIFVSPDDIEDARNRLADYFFAAKRKNPLQVLDESQAGEDEGKGSGSSCDGGEDETRSSLKLPEHDQIASTSAAGDRDPPDADLSKTSSHVESFVREMKKSCRNREELGHFFQEFLANHVTATAPCTICSDDGRQEAALVHEVQTAVWAKTCCQ